MDTLLELADDYFLDSIYAKAFPEQLSSNSTLEFPPTSPWSRDSDLRICLSLAVLVTIGGWLFYMSFSTLSYFFIFDHETMKHPKFLKNQVRQEIECASKAIPGFALCTVPWFWGEIKGYSLLYDGLPTTLAGWAWLVSTPLIFLLFTDFGIYWIHRWEHHPRVYKYLHKPHHKWVVPTPYASYAFHFLDGYAQSIPYHLFVYVIPTQKWIYICMFFFVNCWTIMIHDGNFVSRSTIINTTAHHAVHHLYFNYNYGQYFTFWDRFGGSHREPTEEQYNAELRSNKKVWAAQAKEAETIEAEVLNAKKQKTN
ncbi:hypothetical protein LRAMOSA06288 [Lichtheimia ramosa]|uniref:Fatty acid hydroxylase domain-containing protein n=1 Tax=Lichtheimia ramosa TaxID=688394 RepID=A0A077X4A9_9FUNG|nr:hypothetical protein LRAMOSA06288 [Lichtheimia ramosa]